MSTEQRSAPADNRSPSPLIRKRCSPASSTEPMIITPGSPKRFIDGTTSGWSEAPSPSAPTRDMTAFELTHAHQHLAAQAALDKSWAKTVKASSTDDALWLDRHSQAGDAMMHQVEQRLKRQFDATTNTTTTAQAAHAADTMNHNTRIIFVCFVRGLCIM